MPTCGGTLLAWSHYCLPPPSALCIVPPQRQGPVMPPGMLPVLPLIGVTNQIPPLLKWNLQAHDSDLRHLLYVSLVLPLAKVILTLTAASFLNVILFHITARGVWVVRELAMSRVDKIFWWLFPPHQSLNDYIYQHFNNWDHWCIWFQCVSMFDKFNVNHERTYHLIFFRSMLFARSAFSNHVPENVQLLKYCRFVKVTLKQLHPARG